MMEHKLEELAGKAALITGSSRGIGRAIALMFARSGARIAAVARTDSALTTLGEEIHALGAECLALSADVTRDGDLDRIVERTMERFGQIDILVNNAAIVHPNVALADIDDDLWRRVIETNLTAPALLTKRVLAVMRPTRRGTIINIASIGGRRGARDRSAYRASKAALINLTETMAAEERTYGIDVNCICPGAVDTQGLRESVGENNVPASAMHPDQIAEVALFLASSRGTAVTGAIVDAFGPSNPLF